LQAISTTFGNPIRPRAVGTVCGYTQTLLQAIGATFGNPVRASAVGTVCGYTHALLQAISATFGNPVRASAVGTVFGYTQALLQAISATFSLQVAPKTHQGFYAAVLHFAQQWLRIALRQSKGADGQAAQDHGGQDLLFHVQAPRKGG
jgi:uncharacterized membrane protein